MKKYVKLICALLAALECLLIVACSKGETKGDAIERGVYRINGENLYFAPTEEIEALREPLVSLLSNRSEIVYRDDGGYDEVIPDPSKSSVTHCYACGLFDVTADGIPELLIHPFGYEGSSGAVDYYVYDIKTGEKITEISSGRGSLCLYFDTERNMLTMVENSMTQGGNYSKYTNFTISTFDSEKGRYATELSLFARYELDAPTQYQNTVEYEINGSPAAWNDYDALYDNFYMNYVRIPETELNLIYWSDVSSSEDSLGVSAEKMAEALLSSGQKFISGKEK